ncbi:DUF1311 domain-containing protein [Pseudomonas fuscovaginae UPB0736]|uniref:Uncharacterized conserved protein YecT, DUF1311 family n=1 Tax=Pseudomonas asplenii TaxID=53407 RepID=A0A1H1T8I4_9PSED|nr:MULTISPECIES: lysozyme inhibitor LprI family protein [Pseudomonas]UUQ62785.1 DUF1311 domain-containing protein [Pseudomonas fuscovaginae UPB0736]UZE28711.1 DUF1311 domain-containing protein [Pseudomonas asplenii]SDS55909.1 Uncharacterized conserved protein YecT, DUF1311 family [Pseudomonas asplenii]SEH98258.1 Uncharacterized conserved protein YecT, DUF1311 family [Pseudomonas fuscovaginae]
MKSIFLALALVSVGVHAAEDTDTSPCDAVADDQQTLECATYNKNTADQLLKENFQALLDRVTSQYASKKAEQADITARLQKAQQLWTQSRDADCAIAPLPAKIGSKPYNIDLNDCLASKSDERSEFLESLLQE